MLVSNSGSLVEPVCEERLVFVGDHESTGFDLDKLLGALLCETSPDSMEDWVLPARQRVDERNEISPFFL